MQECTITNYDYEGSCLISTHDDKAYCVKVNQANDNEILVRIEVCISNMPAEMTKATAVSTNDGNVASEPSTSQESQTSTLKTGPAAKVNVRQHSSQIECSPKGLFI